MKILSVDKLGGLDNVTAEHLIDPAKAVKVEYMDPFRSKPGTIAPCFGFKDDEVDGWIQREVLAAFMLGDFEVHLFTDSGGVRFRYINAEGTLIYPPDPEYDTLHLYPTKVIVDTNPYYSPDKCDDGVDAQYKAEYFQAYVVGFNIETRKNSGYRIILCKRYDAETYPEDDPVIFWNFMPLSINEAMRRHRYGGLSIGISYNDDDDPWEDYRTHIIYYILILEDVFGNYHFDLLHNDDYEDHNASTSMTFREVDVNQQFRIRVSTGYVRTQKAEIGIHKAHLYRVDYTAENTNLAIANIDDLFSRARWRATFLGDSDGFWADYVNLPDAEGSYDILANPDYLGDNIYPGYYNLRGWLSNAEGFGDAIGVHNSAIWLADGNEVIFSEYSLETPYGVRPLNFPSSNRWRFEEIGNIVDLVSLQANLYIFGTNGIKILQGNYLENFYEKKISDAGILKPNGETKEWLNCVTVIDDRIYFIDKEGYPNVLFNYEVIKIPGLKIDIKGYVEHLPGQDPNTRQKLHPINTSRYRSGWIISNSYSIYVYHIPKNEWAEWPRGVRRFIIGLDPYYEKQSLSVQNPNDFSYLRYIKSIAPYYPQEYATDGTVQTSVRKSGQIDFGGEVLVKILIIHWEYNDTYNYQDKQIDMADEDADSIEMDINFYLNKSTTAAKTIKFKPSQAEDGEYKSSIYVNCRCKQFQFEISGSDMKYFRLIGYSFKYEERGRKSYE